MAGSSGNYRTSSDIAREKKPKTSLVASSSSAGIVPHDALKHVVPWKQLRGKHTDQIVVFLLKIAALEAVRRLSKVRCPVVWRVIQGLQVLGCPPFKWLQRWWPFGTIVKAVQNFSRPLLCLSIATAFFECSDTSEREERVENIVDSQQGSESPNDASSSDIRTFDKSDDTSKNIVSDNWIQIVIRELKKEGISLPDRVDEDELRRLYAATRGDLPRLLSSLKRTIRWRETYYILSAEELEKWSTFVFWHGLDMMLRPCLIIRLGVACSSLSPHDRARFSQAVVSQMEHGVVHLVNEADPRITVLMDCQGLSPIRFPMQMMKSCATILQDHYPNRLAILYILRLPPVSRVITQTFMKVLKPATRQKVRIEGDSYLKVLSEFLQSVPAFLGGDCTCSKCRMLLAGKERDHDMNGTGEWETSDDLLDNESFSDDYPATETLYGNCEHYLRAAVVGILLLCIMIAFMAGIYNPNSLLPP